MSTRCVKVHHPGGAYDVVVGFDLTGACVKALDKLTPQPSSLIVVTDSNVARHASKAVDRLLASKFERTNALSVIPAGERSKSLATFGKLHDRCLAHSPDRDAAIVALGGGVVGDVAGFLAATLLRGVRIVHIPTSLLAMVDSAIGGKTAINHARGKNLIGAFHHPAAVFADLAMLGTLPEREYVNALGEVVKYGVVLNAPLFAFIERNAQALLARDATIVQRVVLSCVRNKAQVVSRDPHEKAERIVLNYGHTVGHAIEKVSGYRVAHGEAVAIGMVAAARIGERAGVTPPATCERQEALLVSLGLPVRLPKRMSVPAIVAALAGDKKRRGGALRFILPGRIGTWTTWETKDTKPIAACLREMQP
ncbi:MAG: 3-dehydroquinate synthase [Planctomycetes bacterium]|nr:3-dehydroquinate synthase [Planctomycetota bacterium]NUQ33972.1 3-dehydroquinate synthase [Planctomycetaceae bacterium]